MEKLTFDLSQKQWILSHSSETSSPDEVRQYHALLDMFKSGDFFYILFDPNQGTTTFCSNGVQDLLGLDQDEVDFEALFELIHPDDQAAVLEFEAAATDFTHSLSEEDRWNYKTQYNFRLKSKYGRFKQILFQSIPYRLTESGEMEHLAIFTNVNRLKTNADQHLSFLHLNGGQSHTRVKSIQWVEPLPNLSIKERAILKLLTSGSDLPTIEKRLSISTATLRNHLKHIRNKTEVNSTVHLVAMAKDKNWKI